MNEPLKILCITGWCRNGSTIIGNILNEVPGFCHVGVLPYYVHLVRDPRAVAQSWREPKQYVYAMSASMSTAYWHGFNLAAHAITRRYPDRSLLLRYEDFIADPAGTIGVLLRLCGADPAVNPMQGRMIELHTNHTVTGNPDRFRTGATIVRDADDAWRAGLPWSARLAATALSWPLSGRYAYRSRGAAGPRGAGGRDAAGIRGPVGLGS